MKQVNIFAGFILLSLAGFGQNVGIGTNAPVARLHVADSSVVFTGAAMGLPGDPPVSGEGSRMMWYADKAAFRAGAVAGNYWDKDNIGNYSFAIGRDAMAVGEGSFATSQGIASGYYSNVLGSYSNAQGPYSTVIGFNSFSVGLYSIAIGRMATAVGTESIAIGKNASANGDRSIALGEGTSTQGINAIAMGGGTSATGLRSTAMGSVTTASGSFATAMGVQTNASGNYSTAMGYGTIVTGQASTSMGYNTTASGNASTSMGFYSRARSDYSLVIGKYNDSTATNRLFEIGNGTDDNARSNAMTVLQNGNVGIGSTTPNALLQFANTVVNRKLVLYETVNNDNQYYGLGINAGKLRYQVDATTSEHTFYAGTGAGTSQYVFAVHGDGNIFAPGTFTSTSDARLKKNIVPVDSCLHKIIQLKGYTYNWISPYRDPRQQIGLLAQEVQKLFPQLVTELKQDNNETALGVNYLGLIPVLIEAIKEQQKQIEELKSLIKK